MREPRQHILDTFDPRPLGKAGPRDHDDGKPQLARSVDLGACAVATGVAGDEPRDAAFAHQFAVVFKRERATRDHDLGIGQRQCVIGRIDKAQRIGMLRLGGERHQMLPADREKHAGGRVGQRGNGGREIGDLDPAIAGHARPRRAFQREQRRGRHGAGFDRVAAHIGGEGMGRVDHMRDGFSADEVCESRRATKAADARWQCMRQWNFGAACIGIDSVDPRARKSVREVVGVACSAQNERARHD